MVANFDAGGAAINVLAKAAGATVRVVDIAVDTAEPLSPSIGAHKVRRGSGNIAVEDALSADEAAAAIEAGAPDCRRGSRFRRRPTDRR